MRMQEDEPQTTSNLKIKVIGVGGGGCNAVNQMIDTLIDGVELVSANTDMAVLTNSPVARKLQLGTRTCRGNGAGTNPEVGRKAAEEDSDAIRDALSGADMVFIAAGMGGGTGTGATPVIAHIAREMGIPSLAIVTKPFIFEGPKRMSAAEKGILELQEEIDSLIVIPNERILESENEDIPLIEAFKVVDGVLKDGVINLVRIVQSTGIINIDLQDIKMVMEERGFAMLSAGEAEGNDRAKIATEKAMFSPLIESADLAKARGLLLCVTASQSLKKSEIKQVGDLVNSIVDPEHINVKFGWIVDDSMGETLRVVMLATGISNTAVDDDNIFGGGPSMNEHDPLGFGFTSGGYKPSPSAQSSPSHAPMAGGERGGFFANIGGLLKNQTR